MNRIEINTNIELSELAGTIVDNVRDHDVIIKFILELDLAVADYDFTVNLRDRLSDAIRAEDAVLNTEL